MVGIRLIIEKSKKEKVLSQVTEMSFFKDLKNENIENYKIKNTIVWEFEIEKDIITNHLLSIFSNHWIVTLDDDENIASAISENRIKLEGISWANLELY